MRVLSRIPAYHEKVTGLPLPFAMERQQQQQDRLNKFKPTKLATLWWVWTCPETLLLRLSSSKGNSNLLWLDYRVATPRATTI